MSVHPVASFICDRGRGLNTSCLIGSTSSAGLSSVIADNNSMGILFGDGATYVGGLALAATTGRLPGGFPGAPDELEAADPLGRKAAASQLLLPSR